MLRRDKLHELNGSQLSGLTSPPAYNGESLIDINVRVRTMLGS